MFRFIKAAAIKRTGVINFRTGYLNMYAGTDGGTRTRTS